MKAFLFFLVMAINSLTVSAHEGHDKSPGAVAAPQGGLIQSSGELYIEVVQKSGAVDIFAYTHDLKAISPKELKVSGQVVLPRKTKGETVKFEFLADRLTAKIDSKGSHRFELSLTVVHRNKTEKVKFNIEPQ